MLNIAIENGIINIDTIQKKIEMNERKKFIEKHTYSIWQGKDGKFYTYLPDEDNKLRRMNLQLFRYILIGFLKNLNMVK